MVQGPTGYVGAASVVSPNVAQARRLGNDARKDAHAQPRLLSRPVVECEPIQRCG